MPKNTRSTAGGSRLRDATQGRHRTKAPTAKDVRIARALIGATPQQLATHIGALPDAGSGSWASYPVSSIDRLPSALRTIIGWYRRSSGVETRSPLPGGNDAAGIGPLLQEYISLRSAWESTEAHLLAARMSVYASRDAGYRADAAGDTRFDSDAAQPATASFGFALPGSAPGSASMHDDPTESAPPARRRALLVDDASDILVTVGAFLDAFGFEVVRTPDADLALMVLADGKPVDLLVTDYAMPGMTGKDLAVQACERNPQLKALIISGHPNAEDLAHLPHNVDLLAKPFRRAELFERIRTLLVRQDATEMRTEKVTTRA